MFNNAAPRIDQITGVILAGGESSRFGTNKALELYKGSPLISHVASVLAGIFSRCLLVTNTPERYAFLSWDMTADIFPKAGPLAGIHAALAFAGTERIFIAACDMPLLDKKLIRYLCSLDGVWDAIIPCPGKMPEPLCAIYRKSALPGIERSLTCGERKIGTALHDLHLRKVGADEILNIVPDFNTFSNINRREEFDRLLHGTDKRTP